MDQMTQATEWERLKSLLDEVIDIDLAERRSYFRSRDVDQDTIVEIESLLQESAAADKILETGAVGLAKDMIPTDQDEEPNLAGIEIGPYSVVSELGFGGMGAVYLAKRIDGKFDQLVAIKLLKREFNVENIRQAFKREVEILSKLSHPNIARLLDTGITSDQIPYIVIEYVEGVPIDKYCVEKQLSIHEKLKLFNKVCDIVAFAHRNLVVHRDIKPSNVLVTSDGVPMLLDFGISKIIEDDPADDRRPSTLLNAMTPEYASPEQINGESLTTATDVYSLGVVLYRMLTGELPFARTVQNGGMLKAISDDEPQFPSAVVRANQANNRRELKSGLQGDLDNIVLRSIRKKPELRYQSVEQFSADIWRFIDGRPVEARPATRTYRLRKFYIRNKAAVAAAVFIFAASIAGTSVALWQANVARASAAIATNESENAKAELEKSEKISKFMMQILSYANPHWHAEGYRFGGEARVIDALADMESKIDPEFADQPDVLAEIHHQFSDIYHMRAAKFRDVEAASRSRFHANRALELRRAHYGDWHELVAKDMAFVFWTADSRNTETSIRMLSDAIVMMRATNPKNRNLPFMLEGFVNRLADESDQKWADLYFRLAPQPLPNDRFMAADQLFDEMLELMRSHFAEDGFQVSVLKCRGSVVKFKANKLSEAQDLYNECDRYREKLIANGMPILDDLSSPYAEYQRLAGIVK